METITTAPGPVAGHRRRAWSVPLALGGAAAVLTAVGLSGVGDAPDPKAPAADILRHFVDHRGDVLAAAPFAYAGAVALVLFAVHLARRLRHAGERGAAVALTAGGGVCAAYLAGVQVAYTTVAYEVAATPAAVAKVVLVGTVLAAPVLGAGAAALLGGLAWGDRRAQLVPRWLVVASAAGAAATALAVVSFGQRDLFSPDLQQQIAGNVVVLWPLVTGAALAWRSRRRPADDGGAAAA